VHVLLDEERYRRTREVARARGVSVGELVRRALDREVLEGRTDARAAAGARLLAADPVPLPD